MDKRFLIIGATGVVGHAMFTYCKESGLDVIGTTTGPPIGSDIYQWTWSPFRTECSVNLEALIRTHGITNVILTAAFTNVDAVEINPIQSYNINVMLPIVVASICKHTNTHLTFLSSGYVFPESEEDEYDPGTYRGFNEEAARKPLNLYGLQKCHAEDYMYRLPNALIVRTVCVYGPEPKERPKNWIARTLRRAKERQTILVTPEVAKQKVHPTYSFDLAKRTINYARYNTEGVRHIVGPFMDRLEWLKESLHAFGYDPEITFDSSSSGTAARATVQRFWTLYEMAGQVYQLQISLADYRRRELRWVK